MSFDVSEAFIKLTALCAAKHVDEPLPSSETFGVQQLGAVQRLLLHPKVTVEVVSLFRPLVLHLVSKLVLLLTEYTTDVSEQPSRAVNIHAAVAFLTVLELAPQCERQVVQYFNVLPPPFYYIQSAQDAQRAAAIPAKTSNKVHPLSQLINQSVVLSDAELCWATLRGLRLSSQLRGLWRWPKALSLLRHPDPDVRFCAVQCTALTFGFEDAATTSLSQRALSQQDNIECALKWQGAQALLHAAKAAPLVPRTPETNSLKSKAFLSRSIMQSARAESLEGSMDSSDSRKRKCEDLSSLPSDVAAAAGLEAPPGYVTMAGVELAVRKSFHTGEGATAQQAAHAVHALVSTPSVQTNLQSLVLGLCTGSPVLLQGPPGSGKSAMIEHIAEMTGNAGDMVRIHLDDQMDSKSLVGAYVCTSRPGEFAWQPGPLAQAVAQGRWVLVEDINLAPAEVLAALVPLLERNTLHIAARAEVVKAAQGFQLLATVTSAPGGTSSGAYGSSQGVKDLLGGLFHYVNVEPPTCQEQMAILGSMHPSLAALLPHAMATLDLFQAAYGQTGSAHSSGKAVWEEAVQAALSAAGMCAGELGFSVGRHFSLRDLVKLCGRMAAVHRALLARSLKPGLGADYQQSIAAVPLAVREAMFCEAADCFCGLVGRTEVVQKLLGALCALWALPNDVVEQYTSLHKPALNLGAAEMSVGRATLPLMDTTAAARTRQAMQLAVQHKGVSRFAPTSHALRNIERVAVATSLNEPVLLVGETGTGKTTLVQQIAKQVGAKLVVLNVSQQTDSSDLLGGFRPVQPSDAVLPLLDGFCDLVRRTWWRGNNEEFLARVSKLAQRRKWGHLVKAFRTAVEKVQKAEQTAEAVSSKGSKGGSSSMKHPKKKAKKVQDSAETGDQAAQPSTVLDAAVQEEWRKFGDDLSAAEASASAAEGGFCFAFVEGVLLKAMREGWWLLLDEVNLAPPEALERIAGLLEDADGSLVVAERGDAAAVSRHPSFRLFAAMNPATDAGKRDLPAPLRNRFTEFWVGEPPSRGDLAAIVAGYLAGVVTGAPIDAVVEFYLGAKSEADTTLQDGAGHKPAYNLRTLCRALEYAATAVPVYGLQRALYDGFAMSFLTQLDPGCAPRLEKLMLQHLVGQGVSLKSLMRAPPTPPGPAHVLFDHFWVETGPLPLPEGKESDGTGGSFVLTPMVSQHLRNLARAVLLRKYPILLQGPTSSGKTSLVAYLAAQTGHKFVRINNHEQTDLQEYLGSYVSDETGRLVFREGLLVQAVRQGHWIVLDELNLAPTEVLEALNRLLDDNRELYVPELQETVKPHPHFMLFATQNPPGIYAGRKVLSRAFRSRFLELLVEDIPDNELVTILEKRCAIAPSYASKLVVVMRELQRRRASSNVFAGRHGFITPRDLFRWAGRGAVGYQQLAEDGFAVLGERLRSLEERRTVQEVLQKVLGAKLDMEAVYQRDGVAPLQQLQAALVTAEAHATTGEAGPVGVEPAAPGGDGRDMPPADGHGSSVADVAALQSALGGVVWTHSMSRMYCLLERCLAHSEPALLVGETGTGKTTVCQMAAFIRGQRLHIINCNQHTEVSDFLGGFRPNRHRERSLAQFQSWLNTFNASPLLPAFSLPPLPLPATPSPAALHSLVSDARDTMAEVTKRMQQEDARVAQQAQQLQEAVEHLAAAAAGVRAPFEWVDGPLVEAMKRGDIILVDELNLAEDAVLERLNSVLEPGRTLTLAERGGAGAELITAHPDFRIVATMNPGGDYGKKELSPALSNRFTSIWVPAIDDLGELKAILGSKLADAGMREAVVSRLLQFWSFFKEKVAHAARQALSVRDLLAWAHFITATAPSIGVLPAYAHGAHLVLLDGIGLGVGLSAEASQQLKDSCHSFLLSQLPDEFSLDASAAAGRTLVEEGVAPGESASSNSDSWGIAPFYVKRQGQGLSSSGARFDFGAPTTARNALRVLRALQLRKPLLLEGSPGVGKTSLVSAMAKTVGQELVRINLSEQTDMMDLLGADLPVEGGAPGEFAWSDGPLLRAIRTGAWVLLDELNLANQTVLEGLNAVLDHREEVFIPELGRTFRCPQSFRVFAAQNPLQEGGGRKGLPKSFLNRFMRVHVDLLQQHDLRFIAGALHPRIPSATVDRMVAFLQQLHHDANVELSFATAGGPWEFNLRDLLRWCLLAEEAVPRQRQGKTREGEDEAMELAVQHYAHMLFSQRLRTPSDRSHASTVLVATWAEYLRIRQAEQPSLLLTPTFLQVGWATVRRVGTSSAASAYGGCNEKDMLGMLPSQLSVLESAAECISRGWMCLLVGPTSSGKTSVARNLAQLCGRALVELPLTSGTDTSDLLGGFEQMEPQRKLQDVGRLAEALVATTAELALTLDSAGEAAQQAQQGLQSLVQVWERCRQSLTGSSRDNFDSNPPPASHNQHARAQQLASLQLMAQVASCAQGVCNALGAGGARGAQQAAEVATRVRELSDTLSSADTAAAGKFEWVDGALTRAIEEGEWVLLDNANLCNPTVLDRLNPLLEPQGELYLNECGTGPKGPRVLTPHPDFRLFLALDPRHGEVSRAMRNRGIEIFLLPDDLSASTTNPSLSQAATIHPSQALPSPAAPLESSSLEAEMIVGFEGVPGGKLAQAMAAAHAELAGHAMQRHRRPPSFRELKRWASLTAALGSRGWELQAALHTAFDQVYVRGEIVEEARLVAAAVYDAHLGRLAMQFIREGARDASLFWPAVWPQALTTPAFASHSLLSTISRDGSILLQQLAHLSCPKLAAELAAGQQPLALDASQPEVHRLGVAASALLPGPFLISALCVTEPCWAAGSSMEEAGEDDEVTGGCQPDAWPGQHAMLCLLAAALVFTERATPSDASARSGWATAISQQVQQLLACIPGLSLITQAAGNAGQVVEGVLKHPLVAELASLHASLAAQLQLPHHMAGLLPLDPTHTQLLQPFLLAAGLVVSPDTQAAGEGMGGVWGKLQGMTAKLRALRATVEAAVLMRGALESMEAEVHAEPATLLQLSCWRYHHPKERTRRAAPHPSVDWLFPVLHEVQGVEETLLQPAGVLPWSDQVDKKLTSMQEWRWALYHATHAHPEAAAPEQLKLHFEGLAFLWLRLSGAIRALLECVAASATSPATLEWAEGAKLARVSHQLDASLGLAGRVPDVPYLWKSGGRPLLPRSSQLCERQHRLLALCEATRVGVKGFELDHRQQPLLLSQAGIEVAAPGPDDGRATEAVPPGDLASAAESAAASVACNVALRSALLEGLCLFASGAVTASENPGSPTGNHSSLGSDRRQEHSLAEIPPLLAAKVEDLAVAAVKSSLALQQSLRSSGQEQVQPEEGEGEGQPTQAPSNAAMVAVPDVRAGEDEGAGSGGLLPEIFHTKLMHFPSCRAMQLGLLALQDIRLSTAQLQILGSGVLRLLCPAQGAVSDPSLLQSGLSSVIQLAVQGGCCSVATVAPHQQLVWMLQAQQQQAQQQQGEGTHWQKLLLQSLAHEAWYAFHRSLWEGCAGLLPAGHADKLSPTASEAWCTTMAGPMRIHASVLTAHASAMVASATTAAVADRSAAVLQLKLAARQLRRLAAGKAAQVGSPHAVAIAEWAAAAAVMVSTLEAHLPSIQDAETRMQVAAALRWLVEVRCSAESLASPPCKPDADADARLLSELLSAFGSCGHLLLQALLPTLVIPCLQRLLECTQYGALQTGTAGLLHRGRVWSMLGLLRLHLSMPPVGSDPAAKYALLRQHLLSLLRLRVEPELAVRRQYRLLPGGPDESSRIGALERQVDQLQEAAEKLEGRCVPRPVPPAYFGLREEVARFVEGLGSIGRMLPLVEALSQGDPSAASQAGVWQQNAGAWLDRLGEQFVGYHDILQPVQLAVQEVRYGLSLMAGAASLSTKPHGSTVDAVVSQLMGFPHVEAAPVHADAGSAPTDMGLQQGGLSLNCSEARLAVADLAAAAATEGLTPQEGLPGRATLARMTARLRLLRVSLHRGARAVAAAREGSPAGTAAVLDAQLRLHAIFAEFVNVWEEIKAEEERRAAEEAELFKSKARNTEFATEEQEDEADYQEKFPEHFAAFADLAGDEEPPTDLGAQQPLQPLHHTAEQAEQAAAYTARDLVQGEVLRELVAVHAAAFDMGEHPRSGAAGSGTACRASSAATSVALDGDKEFLLSYELGTDMLRGRGLCLPGAVDGATATGHLLAITLRHRQLSQPPSGDSVEVDMQAAYVEEAVLVQRPLHAVQARLGDLLEEWPDHPVLMQLSGIAGRLLALPVTSPLKQLMTGVELLLARAQVWEESAAKHVSLASQLGQVSALATRWRKLELASWKGLLQRTVESFARGADKAWFHLYRILVVSTTSVAEVAAVVEQFMQACPVGEFMVRLQLLHSFYGQLTSLSTRCGGTLPAGAGIFEEQGTRWQQLEPVLYNVCRYYAQFGPHVEKQMADGLKQLEKELQDFVSLAKWEDRSFYAQRIAVEKAQRQLHRLSRRALQELKEPAGAVLTAAARSMGFNDLAAPGLHLPELGARPSAAAEGRRAKAKDAANAASAADLALVGEGAAAAAAAAFNSACQAALGDISALQAGAQRGADTRMASEAPLADPGMAAAGPEVLAESKYASQLPRLTRRFHSIVLTGLQQEAMSLEGAAAIEHLAGDVAERALSLRTDTEKGARARKKKALTDLLKGLSVAGVSRRRSAVPPACRGVQAWFQQGGADAGPLLSASNGVASGQQLESGAVAWAKADAYYFRTMARMQRLWEAANRPHADVAPHEVEAACRMSEHMMYLVQHGRDVLGTLGTCYAQLSKLAQLLNLLALDSGSAAELLVVPPQDLAWQWYTSQSSELCRLVSVAAGTARLLRSAAAAETAPTPKGLLGTAADTLERVVARLTDGQSKLAVAMQVSVSLPSSHLFVPPTAVDQLQANATMLSECDAEVGQLNSREDFSSEVPGWHTLAAALSQAASKAASSAQQLQQPAHATGSSGDDPSTQQAEQELGQQLRDRVERAVEAMLVWAQHARPTEASVEEGKGRQSEAAAGAEEGVETAEEVDALASLPIPQLLRSLESRMQASRVLEVCTQATAALTLLAASTQAPSTTPHRLAAGVAMMAPMLSMLRSGLCQLALQYLGALKATSKLSYVCTSLFAGLVQQGFCMPEAEAKGEGGEGDGKMTEGTGLGEGDTRGAKDISEQLEDQDQLLGAKQKGQEEEEQREEDAQQDERTDKQQEEKGVEMDDDFEGSLEDLQQDPNARSEGEEEDGDEDRVDQQMGEAGAEAEAVDERMWDEEDKEDQQGKQEDAGYDEDTPLQVDDKSTLDYASGQEKPEEQEGKEEGAKPEAQQAQQQQPQPEEEGEGGEQEERGEEEEWGDYPDRHQDQEGHVQPEGQEQEFELPEDLNLDGGEEEAGAGEQEEAEEERADQEAVEAEGGQEEAQEQGGAFPEGPEDQGPEEGMEAGAQDDGGGAEGEDEGEGEQQQGVEGLPQAGEEEGGEQELPAEDVDMAEAQHAEEDTEEGAQQAPAEAGPKGLPSAAAAAAAAQQGVGGGDEEEEQARLGQDEVEVPPHTGQLMPSGAEAPPEAGGSAAGAASGMQRDMAAQQQSAAGRDQSDAQQERRQQGMSEANPYRNLGSALERWRARLVVTADAEQPQHDDAGAQQEPEVLPQSQPPEEGDEEGAGGEVRFLGADEGRQQGDTQALAAATEEQAAATSAQREQQEAEAAGMEEDVDERDDMQVDQADEAQQAQQELASGQANWGAGAGKKAGIAAPKDAPPDEEMQGEEEEGPLAHEEGQEEGGSEEADQEGRGAGDSYVTAKLAAARLEDDVEEGEEGRELLPGLSPERAQELRDQLEQRLRASSDGTLAAPAQGGAAHGREVWSRCEALTSGLVGELTEQLRLILEPTLASKLAGDYRTGKRINMKKVISYIASQFRKDKIWLRRTRPDKRRYQVVVAVDDSRSMAETGTAGAALEAVTLICRAMARLEVGELGVVSFGGGGGVMPLHLLEKPFTDSDGVTVMSQMRFDQDNTITDRPMVELITSLQHVLEGASARSAAAQGGGSSLHQLVLIIADGRFHEKESLRRMVREATSQPGVLYAFIVLDNPDNSILDMQSVSFVGGKPVFTKYMDSFPFPFYIVLRETAALPCTLADLLRQWFELCST